MAWSEISFCHRTSLVFEHSQIMGQRYVDKILRPVVSPVWNVMYHSKRFRTSSCPALLSLLPMVATRVIESVCDFVSQITVFNDVDVKDFWQ